MEGLIHFVQAEADSVNLMFANTISPRYYHSISCRIFCSVWRFFTVGGGFRKLKFEDPFMDLMIKV